MSGLLHPRGGRALLLGGMTPAWVRNLLLLLPIGSGDARGARVAGAANVLAAPLIVADGARGVAGCWQDRPLASIWRA